MTTENNLNSVIDVSAGVVFRRGLLLITQRRPGDHLGGLWEFPGGKRHVEESDEDCLRRELMEELGIEVEVKELLETITHEYPEKAVRLKFFRACSANGHEPGARWDAMIFTSWDRLREQLRDYAFPAADAQLLAKLQSTPELWR